MEEGIPIVRRFLIAVAVVLATVAWCAPASWAHAVLVRSSPAARATLARPPERVHLWFNERLEPAYSRASVWDAAGRQVDASDAAVAAAEPTRLTVELPALKPGMYTVKFRVLSVDGHLVESQFPFTVREPR